MKKHYFLYFIALVMPVFLLGGLRAQNENIKIGILMPLSNKNATFGTQTRNGIKLFIDELNENGGLNGKRLIIWNTTKKEMPQRRLSDIIF